MGNPAPQLRSNSPKTNVKPKHRQSGSVSNISFTSKDAKPKHRHSGSVSNISFTPEDVLKPKHRKSGSVSNISITVPPPEELKDLKPKHRRSGSVSSSIATTNAEDFRLPSRSSSPLSSVPSSLSASSLKEKRNKRRTRSSLGGTKDFVKELDFLATPPFLPNGRTLDNSSTRKELLKPSPSPPLPESAPLQAAEEVLAPVLEAPLPVHEEGFGASPAPTDQKNDIVVEEVNAGENGGSPRGENSFNSANIGDTKGSPPQSEKPASSANVGENGGSPHDGKTMSFAKGDIVLRSLLNLLHFVVLNLLRYELHLLPRKVARHRDTCSWVRIGTKLNNLHRKKSGQISIWKRCTSGGQIPRCAPGL